jgi:hypothetical protein
VKLGKDALLLGREVDDAVGKHKVDRVRLDGQILDMPSSTSTFASPAAAAFALARSIIAGVMSTPITLPVGPASLAASKRSMPAPEPRSSTVSPSRISASATGFPQPKELATASAGSAASASRL